MECKFGNRRCLCKSCERNAAFDGCESGYCIECFECEREGKAVHAADVAPVRNGRWLYHTLIDGHIHAECSECHKVRIIDNYCPNCGAKMDSEECCNRMPE